VDAVDGANLDARGVLGSDAGFGDDVCHGVFVLSRTAWRASRCGSVTWFGDGVLGVSIDASSD
jgi:hypothetical protein